MNSIPSGSYFSVFLLALLLLSSAITAAAALYFYRNWQETRHKLSAAESQLQQLQNTWQQEREARLRAEVQLTEWQNSTARREEAWQETISRLKESFQALAGEALAQNSQHFLQLAQQQLSTVLHRTTGELKLHQQAVASLVQPLKEVLERYEQELQQAEQQRREEYGRLTRYLEEVASTQQALQNETRRLVTALRTPQVRGRWGEMTLQRVVELAGMSKFCDFVTQATAGSEDGLLRPDLIVKLPDGRQIVVDAKAPLAAYLDAIEAEDETLRQQYLVLHAQQVRSHLLKLSSKEYQKQFQPTPDFVVLFLPGESFFSAALEQDRSLIEEGINRRVVLATPTTLIALLRAVAYSWQQYQAAENARLIAETGRELYERICRFAEHLVRMRDGLQKTLTAYNDAVGSWTSRLLPGARRLKELGSGVEREPKEVESIEIHPRQASLPPGE